MEVMYHFNHHPENWTIKNYAPGKHSNKNSESWGGGCTHRLMSAAYTIAFLCLLQFNEVLKIQVHDIKFVDTAEGSYIELLLPFQKTEQCGGESISSYKHSFTEFLALEILPFVLYPLPEEEAHLCLCPV
jgi:hypothetical protein